MANKNKLARVVKAAGEIVGHHKILCIILLYTGKLCLLLKTLNSPLYSVFELMPSG